jgi:hypothetical protein
MANKQLTPKIGGGGARAAAPPAAPRSSANRESRFLSAEPLSADPTRVRAGVFEILVKGFSRVWIASTPVIRAMGSGRSWHQPQPATICSVVESRSARSSTAPATCTLARTSLRPSFVLAGGNAHVPAEGSGELALIGNTAFTRYRQQRELGIPQ